MASRARRHSGWWRSASSARPSCPAPASSSASYACCATSASSRAAVASGSTGSAGPAASGMASPPQHVVANVNGRAGPGGNGTRSSGSSGVGRAELVRDGRIVMGRGSSQDPGCWDRDSRDERPVEGGEEGLTSTTRVVDHLEEGEIGGQLLLRDAAVRAEPGAQQRPQALGGVDVDLAEAVAVLVARVLAPGVAHGLVPVAPLLQAPVDVVLVGVHQGAPRDRRLDHRPDRPLPDVGEHTEDDLAPALDQAQDGRLVLGERAAAGSTPQPPPAARPPFFATAAGWPLWPATT